MQTASINTLLIAILSALFSSLITYFVRTVSISKIIKTSIEEAIFQHEKVFHKDEVVSIVKEEISNHEKHCQAPEKLEIIFKSLETQKTALIFLVSQNGGNPKNLGL